MDLVFGTTEKEFNSYNKRNVFNGFSIWTRDLNSIREHYHDAEVDGVLYIVFGDIYQHELKSDNLAEICGKAYMDGGLDKVFEVDGDFIFARIVSNSELTILQSNYGGINLYYRIDESDIYFSTDASLLLWDFSEKDIDDRSVCDFLLYGSMVGGNTFSRNVKALLRGQALFIKEKKVQVSNFRTITFDSGYSNFHEDKVIDILTEKYLNAVCKRQRSDIANSAMFLSGGKDSRLLLSAFSTLFEDTITCVSFGQFGADETWNAGIAASINANPFRLIILSPDDHIKYASRYICECIGMDWFPQSYVITVMEKIKDYSQLYTGSYLSDICFHSKYLAQGIEKYIGSFVEFMREYHVNARMTGFSKEKLRWICGNKSEGLYEIDRLEEEANKYEGRPEDVFIGFMNNINGSNQISFRTDVFPRKYMDVLDPAQDKDFIQEVCHLPLQMRLSDSIHFKMIQKINSQYLMPVYNDYKIPMQETNLYREKAAAIEAQREQLYIQMMREWNPKHTDKFYYTHDYADFNGFMKYDDAWIAYMNDMLLDREAIIYKRYFIYERVKQMLYEHRNDVRNWKKELILLTSLEQFLRIYCRGY